MRKIIVSALVLGLVLGMAYAPVLSAGSEKRFVSTLPRYEKLDPEVVSDEAANWDHNNRGQLHQFTDPETGEMHYAIGIEQADGQFHMERYVNDGDAGDVLPGTGNVAALNPEVKSAPNTVSWLQWQPGRSVTGIKLYDIVENADQTVTLKVSLGKQTVDGHGH
ncbi:MAG: hypothetical protein WD024_01520 [Bacillota bacterium]